MSSSNNNSKAVVRDITNERLHEEILENAFQNGPQPILITGIDGKILKINLAFTHRLNLKSEDVVGTSLKDRTHPDEIQRDLEILGRIAAGELKEAHIQKRYREKNGTWVIFDLNLRVITDTAGSPKYIISHLRDLTTELVLEEQLSLAKQKITDNQKFINGTVENISSLVSYIDKNYCYQFVNSSYLRWFDRKPEQCLGQTVSSIIGDLAFAQVKPEMERALAGQPQIFEKIVTYKNGETKYLHVHFKPDIMPDGSVNGFYNIVEDITKAKETELNLQQTLKAIENSAIMSISDSQGHIIFANDNFCNISGYSKSELIGKDHRLINSGVHSKEFFRNMWQTALNGNVWTGEVCNKAKNGKKYWVRSSVAPIYDLYGKISKFMSVRFDISDRKCTELELAQKSADLEKKERLLTKILDGVPSPIAHWSRDQKNIHANKAYSMIRSQISGDITGKSALEILGAKGFNAVQEKVQEVLSGKIQNFELELTGRDGSIRKTITSYIPDIENGEVQGFFSISTDMTEIHRLEQEKVEAQARMATSAKMSSLGEMAAGIAHEINNPLAVILGKVGQLRRKVESGSADKDLMLENISKIESTTQRIVKIIKGLSAFSRNADSDPMEKTKLGRVVDDTIELCAEKYKTKGVTLKVGPCPDIDIECRAAQISQVLVNLLNNASDAVGELSEKWVQLDFESCNNKIILSVTDSGHGIPKEILAKLMQPFFTTKGVGKGTGLGLSVSKNIIEGHHGKLTYDETSANTRFVIELPIRQHSFQHITAGRVA